MPYPITKRQKQVYDFVKVFIDDKGYSPTLEEIKKRLKLSAVSTIHQHINALIDKGYIKKFDNLARAIEIKDARQNQGQDFIEIPLLGMIAAGEPIEAIEIPETVSVPKDLTLGQGRHYALKVKGDSMQDAGIFDSDTVIVREQPVVDNGEIGVAIVNGNEATLKRIYKEKNGVRLQPANKNYKPILTKNVLIQGRVTGVLRSRFDPLPKPAQLPLFMYPQKNEQLLQIHNRRFLGNKTKLLGFIGDIVADKCRGYYTFCDIFAGTGVVGQYFNRPDTKIISNDILDSSFASLQCWLGTKNYNKDKISNTIEYLNSIEPKKENYVSENFGNSYFTKENAQKIGAIRDEIEKLNSKGEISNEEKNVLLTSLVYAIDKVANTVGHYEAYRKKLDTIRGLRLLVPDIDVKNNTNNEIYQKDANQLAREIKCDVLYIDPPYNSRQYGDSYHLLENIVTWKKPKVEGVAKKMVSRGHLKSRYCVKGADNAFEDLIQNVKAKHILVSYNNTGEKKNVRSNAKIPDERIIAILKNKGDVEVFERDYKGFTAGKSDTAGHTERVFYCKVTK